MIYSVFVGLKFVVVLDPLLDSFVHFFLFIVASAMFVESMKHGISDPSFLLLFLLFYCATQRPQSACLDLTLLLFLSYPYLYPVIILHFTDVFAFSSF